MKELDEGAWNPYLAGALTGLLIIVSVLLTGIYFGTSTSFIRAIGSLEKVLAPSHFSATIYFSRYAPKVDWQMMFVAGIFLGSLVSSTTSGSFKWQAVPDMWASSFGTGESRRAVVAFAGGVIAMIGARLAGG
jgi:hypothetical protein